MDEKGITAKEVMINLTGRERNKEESKKDYVTFAIKTLHKKYGFIEANRILLPILKELKGKDYLKYVSNFDATVWLNVLRVYHGRYE